MKHLLALLLAVSLTVPAATVPAAWAQDQPEPKGLRTSLSDMLSLLTLGTVSMPDSPAAVSQSGGIFHMQLPLGGFAAPAGATAEIAAHADADGVWDVTSLAFPSAGAIGPGIDEAVSYTVGQQTIRGRLDPTGATPSTFNANLGKITVQSAAGGQNTEQTIERASVNGSLSPAPDGRIDLLARDSASNLHTTGGAPRSDSQIRHLDGHITLSGLDRTQGVRLIGAVKSFMQTAKSRGGRPNLSPAERAGLRGVLDATAGVLTRIEVDETVDAMKFSLGDGSAGGLGHLQLRMTGGAEDQTLNAAVDLSMDNLSLASLPADSAAFMPHHLTGRSVLAGVPLAPLMALLRAALAPAPDQAVLAGQETALLNTPGAHADIESLTFDAGPAHVSASVHFLPRPNGEAGADIHIAATGVDALLAMVQAKPGLRGIMPFVFIAKGIGRQRGDSIVWDISMGGEPLTVNGMPFGQSPARTR